MGKTHDFKEAVLWHSGEGEKVHCDLCNWRCLILPGKFGYCGVRQNIDGKLYSRNYAAVCAANVDPIEKKPLFHFQPGSKTFSIAAVGCNFKCTFCQNWQISQCSFEKGPVEGTAAQPEYIVASAIDAGCKSIAYTYTEPTIFMELCNDCARPAKANGLANVFVSNGYMTTEAIDFASDWLDAINIDLKGFTDDYYKRLCKARLQPVLDTIKHIAKETNIWMELTTLIVPGENDSPDELKQLAEFIVAETGVDTPWHISRFYPTYEYTDSIPTPLETLQRAYDIGKQAGMNYVYMGNVPGSETETTYCHNCGIALIERAGYTISANNVRQGHCPDCGAKIAGFEI